MGYLLFDVFLTHFAIGFGFCLAVVIFFRHCNRRRPILRFGGDDPFSWGDKKRWRTWILSAYAVEVLFSLHPQMHLSRELALSAPEALSLTLGLFLVDRIAMIFFEPESHWKIQRPKEGASLTAKPDNVKIVDAPKAEEPKGLTAPVASEVIAEDVPSVEDKSWFAKNVEQAAHSVSSSSGSFLGKIGKSIGSGLRGIKSGLFEIVVERRKAKEGRRQAQKEKEAEERRRKLERFEELTRSRRPS